jgi:hypothetical protein
LAAGAVVAGGVVGEGGLAVGAAGVLAGPGAQADTTSASSIGSTRSGAK